MRSALVTLLLVVWASAARADSLVAGEPADNFDLTTFASGIDSATDITFLPGGRAVITAKGGNVIVRTPDGTQMSAGRITLNAGGQAEQGLLGVVADPAFDSNKTLYFYASQGPADAKHRVLKIVLGDDNLLVLPGTILVDRDTGRFLPGLEGPANHNGGGLVIYQNQLYVSVGDTGLNSTPPVNNYGTCLNKPNGKILRVNLDGSVPGDNPLVGLTSVSGCNTATGAVSGGFMPDTRIFAWGFRNPFRFWIDPSTSKLWIGDVGETTREEISVGGKGMHFGWPFYEGTVQYTANGCSTITPSRTCTPAVFDYGRAGNNNCVIGGLIPSGCGWSAPWNARYFYADHGSSTVFNLDVNGTRDGIVGSLRTFALVTNPAVLRMGLDHALYVVNHGGASVTRFAPKGLAALNCTPAPVPGGTGGTGGTGGASDGGTDTPGDMAGDSGGSGGAGGTGGSGGAVGSGGSGGGTDGAVETSGSGGAPGTGGVGGTGGSGGAVGTGGSGGAPGTGGEVGTGGSGAGGMAGSDVDAAADAEGGAGGSGSGGTTVTGTGGGSPADAGDAGKKPPFKTSGGCGCEVGTGAPTSFAVSLFWLLVLGARRRRVR